MAEAHTGPDDPAAAAANGGRTIPPSFRRAVPHFLALAIFPLIAIAALQGGWWIAPPLVILLLSGPLDGALAPDTANPDPAKAGRRRLLWYDLAVWLWGILWPLTLAFSLWQMLVAGHLAAWEIALMALVLAGEAQAVFVVSHELVHRRTVWERRLGEFLLASVAYPHYATEHIYIHHAQVGTPLDVGSAPKGQSIWRYFPREVASNLVGAWRVARERLARRRLPVWHIGNPFWRYGLLTAFWYGLVYGMGGWPAVAIYALLCLLVVFSMKVANYIQHYGLRRIRRPDGRFEKALPRHSWTATGRFSNWIFFNTQRHADHHAAASRPYPLLQHYDEDESPQLPESFGTMFGLAVRPRRWFQTMDPLVDRWRAQFYPEVDDWTAYDSPVAEARPEAFDAIVEIFGAAPRLAQAIERNPELLDTLREREFAELDLPAGFWPDPAVETAARQGLVRLYWTHEFGVAEMKERIAEIPAQDADDTVDTVRNWSNDKSFQIGIHTLRGNLSPVEAGVALANVAEASVAAVLSAVAQDFAERRGVADGGGVAAILLGDLASGEAAPGAALDLVFVCDGPAEDWEALCRAFRQALRTLSRDSLLFAPLPRSREGPALYPLAGLGDRYREAASADALPDLTRARCVFETGEAGIAAPFETARRGLPARDAGYEAGIEAPGRPADAAAATGLLSFGDMPGGLRDIEGAARRLRAAPAGDAPDDPAPTAASAFRAAAARGAIPGEVAAQLAEAATLWRNLHGILQLVADNGFVPETAHPQARAAIARACGLDDFDALAGALRDTAGRAAAAIGALDGMGGQAAGSD